MPLPDAIAKVIEEKFGRITSVSCLSGGDSSEAAKVQTSVHPLFVKWQLNTDQQPFVAEAFNLNQLGKLGYIRTPEVLHVEPDYLVLEFIDTGKTDNTSFRIFGEQLAQQHQVTHSVFGWESDNYIGQSHQRNPRMNNGYDFFAAARLQTQAKWAKDKCLLESADLAAINVLCNKLPELIPEQPASLLHGDLWGGNFIFDSSANPVLIDPACYYGWREADIAMTLLFGGFDATFYESYQANLPMESGWEKRVPIYNLYHLLNHLNIFGGSYLASVKNILKPFYLR